MAPPYRCSPPCLSGELLRLSAQERGKPRQDLNRKRRGEAARAQKGELAGEGYPGFQHSPRRRLGSPAEDNVLGPWPGSRTPRQAGRTVL
eukprot:scaffold1595_cov119-Isochrysis_galbana.AAC.4